MGIDDVYWGSIPDEGLFRDFVDAVENDRPPLVTGEDGLREAAVVLAAYESDACGAPVDVEYPD